MYHPGIKKLHDLGSEIITSYLWLDTLPNYKQIEKLRVIYESMITLYNHQLNEQYGQMYWKQTINTLNFIKTHVEPIMYESVVLNWGDPSFKQDWFQYHKTFKRNPYTYATEYFRR